MRVASLLAVLTFVALASAPECESQRRSPSPLGARTTEAPLFLDVSDPPGPTPQRSEVAADRPQSWNRHITVGMAVGGAAGLIWGLSKVSGDENVFGLSPVLETAIGIGVGFYAGTAVYLVRRVRP